MHIEKPSKISKYIIAPVTIALAGLGISGFFGFRAFGNKDEVSQEADELIAKTYEIAGGPDRIIDVQETRSLLDKIGLKNVILHDNEVISLSPNTKDRKQIYVNLESGKFGRYMGNDLRGTAGVVPIGVIENYVEKKGK